MASVRSKTVVLRTDAWRKVKEKIKARGKKQDRKKCRLDKGTTLHIGIY